ncbi:hypothetical protein F7725_015803, partial [Dissostichus mawsoni]
VPQGEWDDLIARALLVLCAPIGPDEEVSVSVHQHCRLAAVLQVEQVQVGLSTVHSGGGEGGGLERPCRCGGDELVQRLDRSEQRPGLQNPGEPDLTSVQFICSQRSLTESISLQLRSCWCCWGVGLQLLQLLHQQSQVLQQVPVLQQQLVDPGLSLQTGCRLCSHLILQQLHLERTHGEGGSRNILQHDNSCVSCALTMVTNPKKNIVTHQSLLILSQPSLTTFSSVRLCRISLRAFSHIEAPAEESSPPRLPFSSLSSSSSPCSA